MPVCFISAARCCSVWRFWPRPLDFGAGARTVRRGACCGPRWCICRDCSLCCSWIVPLDCEDIMTAVVYDKPQDHMGMPLPTPKVAMWLFLVTEIMFFTALIGTYIILRHGTPAQSPHKWPTPHQVHLVEWIGALNTFVLICSSFTVVLAHHAAVKADMKKATLYIAITLALGAVFLVIKAYEYNAKFQHDILPGHIGESLPYPDRDLPTSEGGSNKSLLAVEREKHDHAVGMQYFHRVQGQLEAIKNSSIDG